MMQPEISRNIAELQSPARNALDERWNVQAYLRRAVNAEASVLR
jgi:hypothetical protein